MYSTRRWRSSNTIMARSEEKASMKAARRESTLCKDDRPTTAEAVRI